MDLQRSQRLVIQSLLSLTETREADTGRHSRRTQTFARLLAEQLSTHPRFRDYLTRERVDMLASLAPLHDIGKVGVPDRVLQKPTTLTADEYAEIQKHPSHGRDVIVRAERQVGGGGRSGFDDGEGDCAGLITNAGMATAIRTVCARREIPIAGRIGGHRRRLRRARDEAPCTGIRCRSRKP